MDFDFTPEQEQLRDAVQRWVAKDYSFEHRRALIRAGGAAGADPSTAWRALTDLGLAGLAVPGIHGGLDMGPVEAMVVMEELGRGLVISPYAAAALMGVAALRDHGPADLQATWLPGMAEGRQRVVPALQEKGARYRLNVVHTTARQVDGMWRLEGVKNLVPAGSGQDGVREAYVVPARTGGGPDETDGIALFLVERSAEGVRLQAHALQDGARAAELTLSHAPAALIVQPGWQALEHLMDIGIAALCAEAVGAMEALLALTVDYLNTRKQFGVTIGSFQALRHRAADMKMQLELARSMSYYATLKLTAPPEERRRALSQAKVQLGQSMRFVGQQAVQLHGGIGMTDEYAGAHYFKRLTVIELSLGDTLHHLGEVSRRMEDTAGVFA